MPVQLLIVGATARAEAKPLADWIATSLQPADVKCFNSFCDSLAEASSTNWIPDLVIIFQSWPDEYSSKDVDLLFSIAPLARLTVGYGAWCESDGRTRHCWPLAVRVPMHSAEARLTQEWRLLCREAVTNLLPLSASREEVFAADHPELNGVAKLSVAVDSPDPAYQKYLIELLSNDECLAIPFRFDGLHCDVVLFDADPPSESRQLKLQAIREHFTAFPIVAVMSSPRPEAVACQLASGADMILAKLGDQRRILDAITNAAPTTLKIGV